MFDQQPAAVRYRYLKSPSGFVQQFNASLILEDQSSGDLFPVTVVPPTVAPPFHVRVEAMRSFHIEAIVPAAAAYWLKLKESTWDQACSLVASQVRRELQRQRHALRTRPSWHCESHVRHMRTKTARSGVCRR